MRISRRLRLYSLWTGTGSDHRLFLLRDKGRQRLLHLSYSQLLLLIDGGGLVSLTVIVLLLLAALDDVVIS